MHLAKRQKFTGSIPEEQIGFLNWPNTSSPTLGLSRISKLLKCKGRPELKADNHTAIFEPIV
jgi:hypothetical protein